MVGAPVSCDDGIAEMITRAIVGIAATDALPRV